MSNPNDPDNDPYRPDGQPGYPAGSGDPYAPGTTGFPARGGYPGAQAGYPGAQAGDPGGQAGYPGQPQYPGQPPEPARPNTVTYAFWCWIGAIAFSLVGLVLILNSPIWDLAIATARLSASEAIAAQSAVNLLKGFIIFLFVAVAAMFAFLAWKMWAGRNWSRITITVLGVMCALLTALPTSRDFTIDARSYETPQGQWPFYATASLVLAAIVLMFVSASNKYFTAAKTYQQVKAYQQLQR